MRKFHLDSGPQKLIADAVSLRAHTCQHQSARLSKLLAYTMSAMRNGKAGQVTNRQTRKELHIGGEGKHCRFQG